VVALGATASIMLGPSGAAMADDAPLPFTSAPVPYIGYPTNFEVGNCFDLSTNGWAPTPDSFTYQWFADGAPIPDDTNDYICFTDAEFGKQISVSVTAHKNGYATTTETSLLTNPVLGTLEDGQPSIPRPFIGVPDTADTGTWGPGEVSLSYQWFVKSQETGQYQDIPGATSQTYSPTPAEYGDQLGIDVTGSEQGYVSSSNFFLGGGVENGDLDPSVPTIGGSPVPGGVLTADPGDWGPGDVAMSYQWYDGNDGTHLIPGATGSQLVIDPTEEVPGDRIIVMAIGNAPGYGTTVSSSQDDVLVQYGTLTSTTPTISGVAMTGITLTADAGNWTPSDTALTYLWTRVGTPVVNVSSNQDYTPTAQDVGHTLTVTVTGADLGYANASVTSDPTAIVQEGILTPIVASISGTVAVDQLLRAEQGSVGPGTPTLSHQWYRSGVAIPGATGTTYVTHAADYGHSLSVKVTCSEAGYGTVTSTSPVTSKVAKGIFILWAPPTIRGTPRSGSTLTVHPGAWQPNPGFHYQWYRQSPGHAPVKIAGATKATHKLSSHDRHKTVTVVVTATSLDITTRSVSTVGEKIS
jgi:hypothetical protein